MSGDGNFDAPGSEHATTFTPTDFYSPYNACVICITKGVKIFSSDGAAVTTIQVGPNSISPTTVYIGANHAVFGIEGHGFTITGGNANGVVIYGLTAGGAVVTGNVDIKDGTGFSIVGPGPSGPFQCPVLPPELPPACPPKYGVVQLSDNQAIGSGTGFFAQPVGADQFAADTIKYLLQSNLALGTGTGFYVSPGNRLGNCDQCDDVGFGAGNVTASNNVAANSGVGFALTWTGKITGNVATNNLFAGFIYHGRWRLRAQLRHRQRRTRRNRSVSDPWPPVSIRAAGRGKHVPE